MTKITKEEILKNQMLLIGIITVTFSVNGICHIMLSTLAMANGKPFSLWHPMIFVFEVLINILVFGGIILASALDDDGN